MGSVSVRWAGICLNGCRLQWTVGKGRCGVSCGVHAPMADVVVATILANELSLA